MRCASCGMAIRKKPIREEVDGHTFYYCCADCFEEELCRLDPPLRRVFGKGRRHAVVGGALSD